MKLGAGKGPEKHWLHLAKRTGDSQMSTYQPNKLRVICYLEALLGENLQVGHVLQHLCINLSGIQSLQKLRGKKQNTI